MSRDTYAIRVKLADQRREMVAGRVAIPPRHAGERSVADAYYQAVSIAQALAIASVSPARVTHGRRNVANVGPDGMLT